MRTTVAVLTVWAITFILADVPCACGTTIGLDALHGPASSENLAVGSWYGKMREELETEYTLEMLYDFAPATLAGCDAIFISQARDTDESFTPEEISNIHSYVGSGGGLLAVAEGGYKTGSTVENFNDLLGPYGTRVSGSVSARDGHVVSGFVPHPVTEDLVSIGVDFQRRLISITPPAIDLTLGGGEDDILAAADGVAGAGNVVIMSDPCPFGYPGDDTNIYEHDNLQLLMNVSAYVVPEPATLILLGAGGIALMRRRRTL